MNVLIILSSLAMGGAEKNVVSILPYLRSDGVSVMLCTLNKRRDSPLTDEFMKTGIKRFDLGAKRMFDPPAFFRMLKILRQNKIDLIHSQDQDAIIYGGFAKMITGIPFVMTRHVMYETSSTLKEAARAHLVFLTARYFADAVIAVSDAVNNSFLLQAGITRGNIYRIYNGIDLEPFKNNNHLNDIRKKLGWDLHGSIAILVSVLREGKGFEILFGAIPKILKKVPNFQLKIIGGGILEKELRNQAVPFGPVIEFLGQRTDIPILMKASNLLIQSSWSEALPTVLIEAGAAGIPVVATDVGGSAEVVKDGETGYLVSPGNVDDLANKVAELLTNPNISMAMGVSARKHIMKRFTLKKQSFETVNLYREVALSNDENFI